MNLKPDTLEKIERLIPRYPDKKSGTLPLLHLIQEEQGWISPEAIEWIAERLELQPIQVQEVVTFYPMYHLQPIGKVHVKVCRTLSCALVGSYKTCEALEKKLKCKRGETSKDGNYTIEFVECIANCGSGPLVQVDDKLYENVTPDKVDELVTDIVAMAARDPDEKEPTPKQNTPAYNG